VLEWPWEVRSVHAMRTGHGPLVGRFHSAIVAKAAGVGRVDRRRGSIEMLERHAQQTRGARPRKKPWTSFEGRQRPGCDGVAEQKRAERREAQSPSGNWQWLRLL
jgi:hypothetical protein